jgi:hypothetical protein
MNWQPNSKQASSKYILTFETIFGAFGTSCRRNLFLVYGISREVCFTRKPGIARYLENEVAEYQTRYNFSYEYNIKTGLALSMPGVLRRAMIRKVPQCWPSPLKEPQACVTNAHQHH